MKTHEAYTLVKICYKQFMNNMRKYLFEMYSEKPPRTPPHDSFD